MKKRILSLALTVALLITLIPMAAIPAKAASEFTVSQECVDIIKKWEGFRSKPYWDYQQWTVGYGTRVPDGKLEEYQTNGISKEEAEQQLIDHLNKDGIPVNKFIDKYNLTFTQGMFDAVLSICYNCGGSWLNETSTLKTAIIEGWTGTDLLFAFGQWSTAGGVTQPALIRRRLAEANMYLNGIYDYDLPDNYSYVRFDPNGGECEIKTQGYVTTAEPALRAVPTYAGYKFEGWFTDPTGGEQVTKLDDGVKQYTLYAHWSAADGEGLPQDPTEETITGTSVSYQRQIATTVLNSFDNPVKGALVVDAYQKDTVVDIVAEHTDSSGTKWGKIKNGGWINLTYTTAVSIDSTPTESTTITVTANDVNIRKGPGTGYGLNGKANKGDRLVITETATGSGYTWGKSTKGWIALKYTNYSTVSGGNNNTDKEEDNNNTNSGTTTKVTGTVKLNAGTLNVRSGAGTGNKVISYYPNGAQVEILEQKTVGSTIWGRTNKGWISLDYVKLDPVIDDSGNNDNTGSDNTGSDNTGSDNTGSDNTGSDNTGSDNTGSDNTGNDNTGSDNTGSDNTGNDNTGNDNTGDTDIDNGTTTIITGTINVKSGYLNVRKEAGTSSAVVGRLYPGSPVVIYEKKTVGSMVWGRISNGWISMDYVKVSTESTTTKTLTGTVSTGGSDLRVRSGAGSGYAITSYLKNGDKVEILERKSVSGVVWGRISNGWIMMDFVKLDSTDNTGSNTGSSGNTGSTTKTGTVKLTAGTLNVRAGAGMNYRVVSYLVNGAKVTILETKVVDGMTWGRISTGWVSMNYIK